MSCDHCPAPSRPADSQRDGACGDEPDVPAAGAPRAAALARFASPAAYATAWRALPVLCDGPVACRARLFATCNEPSPDWRHVRSSALPRVCATVRRGAAAPRCLGSNLLLGTETRRGAQPSGRDACRTHHCNRESTDRADRRHLCVARRPQSRRQRCVAARRAPAVVALPERRTPREVRGDFLAAC